MTRKEKTEEIVNSIENWDFKEVVSYAMACMTDCLNDYSEEELDEEYNRCFGYDE